MLVIRRRAGESILIGDEVEIDVIELTPTRVKLGIRAPLDVQVVRKEAKLTREENIAAARGISASQIGVLLEHLRPTSKNFPQENLDIVDHPTI